MKLSIENLVKSYGDRSVLDIDHMEIESGRVYAILGLNGSGKSTLLECISGLIEYDKGRINYGNENSSRPQRDRISIMTQTNYMFNKTLIGNIKAGLEFRKYSKEVMEERISKYLKYFNLEHLQSKNAKKFSGGERAKTALLRIAVLETDLTLLDEPTASMDIESTLQAEELIKSMVRNNRTVIMVTHDLFQAQRVADFIFFMDNGKLIEKGNTEEILMNPKSKLVRMILNKG